MSYGLIGKQLSYSFSKIIHEELADYEYSLLPMNESEFHNFMDKKDFKAINVTIPYKEKVIDYLYEIDEKAKRIGAVNTIVNRNNKLYGYNTDYYGFLYMLEKHNVNAKNKTVLILGRGGASKSCKAVFEDLGSNVKIVYHSQAPNTITYDDCYENFKNAEIIVNTTPVGTHPNSDNSPIDLSKFTNLESVIDIVYNPLNTMMLLEASKLNVPIVVGGLEMLVGQALYAVEIFTDTTIEKSKIHDIYINLLKEKMNIALIGMSGSGKTTVGTLLAEKLNFSFIDSDEKIVNDNNQMPISEIFKTKGEPYFRELEHNAIKEISKINQQIISTGGGVIKNENNITHLKKNSLIIWLHRDFDLLEIGNGRPLSTNIDDTKKLYEERHHLYEKYSDFKIDNNFDNPEDSIEKIIEKYTKFFSNL